MPELPEVDSVRVALEASLRGRRVESVRLPDERCAAHPAAEAFCDGLRGRAFSALGRRGKFLYATLDDGGKLVVHHSKSYQVMTNSPVFEQQLALDDYWKTIGGTVFLPGTNRAADRFVRASFYINAIPKTEDTRTALASVFSVIRNTSVPLGISTPNEPNISSTRWRTVSDQKNLTYFFESTLYPNVFWVDFRDVDFAPGAPVKMLDLVSGKTYAGNAAERFRDAAPFEFQGIG